MEKSQWKWLLVSIGFSALVMGGVLYFTVDEMTIEYLSRVNPFYLILAVLLHILSLGFWALRIQKMSASLGYQVGFKYCLNLVLANMLVAAVTPSQAGGEPVGSMNSTGQVSPSGMPPPSSSWSGSSMGSCSGREGPLPCSSLGGTGAASPRGSVG